MDLDFGERKEMEHSDKDSEISTSIAVPMVKDPPVGILRLDVVKPRRPSGEFRHLRHGEPTSPQPSVDRLSVTFAEDSQRSDTPNRRNSYNSNLSPTTMDKVHFPHQQNEEDNSDEEDYSASVSAIMQRRASTKKSKRSRTSRRASSPFTPDILPGTENERRRSSCYTTSSGETAISVEDNFVSEVTQAQIYENIRLHKEVLSNVKMQPWHMRKKIKLVMQAKNYIKRHEGVLQERLAQSHSTKDMLARWNIYLIKRWQHIKRETANLSNWLIPWELRIKEIESHFGSVVASYFTFLRWLFWVNLVTSIIMIAFVTIPELLIRNDQPERKQVLTEDRYNATNFYTLLDFEGILKYSPLFYGWYTDRDVPGKGYRLPLAYFMTGLAAYVYNFVATLRKMAENSRMSKLSEKEDECVFSWKIFTSWDYMIGNSETAANRVASIVMGFKEALLEEAEKKKDTKNWKVIIIRIVVNVTVCGLLALSAYAVVLVVKRSTESEAKENFWRMNEITIVMTLISLVFPMFFEVLGLGEQYHPRKQLRLQLARIMLLNLLNLYSLNFALFDKINDMQKEWNNTLSPYRDYNVCRLVCENTTFKGLESASLVLEYNPWEANAEVLTEDYTGNYTDVDFNGTTSFLPATTGLEVLITEDPVYWNETMEEYDSVYGFDSPGELVLVEDGDDKEVSSLITTMITTISSITTEEDTIEDSTSSVRGISLPITTTNLPSTTITTTTTTTTTTSPTTPIPCPCNIPIQKIMTSLDYKQQSKLRSLCWETMFGQELVKLTVMDLFMTIVSTLAMDFFRGVFVRIMNNCWCWDLEKIFPQYGDFKVAENILHLVNNQGMVWMGMFFSPGLIVINVVKLYVMVYFRSWIVLTCNVPHKIVFRASRSNNFYYALLLSMLFLCVIPVGYAIVWVRPSEHCGPFSRHEKIFQIFTKTLKEIMPSSVHQVLDYIASPGVVIPLLVLMILIIYYLVSLTDALREANNDLKIQLRRERTEERRKLFQIADRRRRVGSEGSGELGQTPFGKWRKLLYNLPSGKSFDDTPKIESEEIQSAKPPQPEEEKLKPEGTNPKDFFSKLIKRALKKSVTSEEEEANFFSKLIKRALKKSVTSEEEEATDTDPHDSLPEDTKPPIKKPTFTIKKDLNPKRPVVHATLPKKKQESQDSKLSVEFETNPTPLASRHSGKHRKDSFDLKKHQDKRKVIRSRSSKDFREDSLTSNWSDNIPVITISKSDSIEHIEEERDVGLAEGNDTLTQEKVDVRSKSRYVLKKQEVTEDEDVVNELVKEKFVKKDSVKNETEFSLKSF
ncbi:TMC domain [Popillia japonica]|uniref:TMC domain n=1 Tax=Popillia japonica TaxID=7064 RepID=A0AAW1MDA3_POPJA